MIPPSAQGPDWERAWRIFEDVADLPPDEQSEALERACAGAPKLRRAIEEMLEADRREDEVFLDRPVLEHPETSDDEPNPATSDESSAAKPPDAAPDSASWLAVPRRLGAYSLHQKIGEGGMSSVYLAMRDDDSYRRRVVVKVIRPGMESEQVAARMRVERQILASLDHPNIARLYDGGTTDHGLPYFVMEYVDGEPIDLYCERTELGVEGRLRLFQKVCAAVAYAHRNLVVHRDIKPNNILVTSDGEPKLLDFGIAKVLNPDLAAPEIEPTVTASRMLTPSYASPEQIRGRLVTTSSDVYSLGVLLYKLLTGMLPFDFSRRSPAEIEQMITDTEPPKPSQVASQTTSTTGSQSPGRPSTDPATTARGEHRGDQRLRRRLAGDLDAIVLKSLRSAPPKRYGSADQLAADIEHHLRGEPVEARRGGLRYRIGKFVSRHRAPLAATGLLLAVLTYFAWAMARQAARLEVERDQARLERDRKQQVITLVEDLVAYAEPFVAPGEELTVRQAVERSLPVLDSRLHDQPPVRAQLLHTTGSMLDRLGAHQEARTQLEEALELMRSTPATAPDDLAATLTALAATLKHLGEYESALDLGRQAVGLLEDLKAPASRSPESAPAPHPLHATALIEVVSILCHLDQYADAESPALEALRVARGLRGDQRQQQMLALDLLATIRSKHGDYPESASLRRQSLALRRELFGESHPSLATPLSNLGLALRWSGELEAAERTYSEALELFESVYGADHYRYAYTLNNLAGVRTARGDHAGALADRERVQTIFRAAAGPDHVNNLFFLLNTEGSRIRVGDAATAERRLRSALGLWRPRLDAGHWLLALGESVHGEALAALGRPAEAEALLHGAFLRLVEMEAKHRFREQAFERLAAFLDAEGRAGEIEELATLLGEPTPIGEG
ncbi:MAG: serine/threonine-protein kinase [Acidobacteriota bacterium]